MIGWDVPGPYRIVFTTRVGGVSEGPYASLNLGRLTADDPERVDENRRRACAAIEADAGSLALNRQVHGAAVTRAAAGARGSPGDVLWTDEPGVPMAVLTADCVPIALTRSNGGAPALALVHAGWRGLLAGVVEVAAAVLGGGRLTAVLGPAIGPCCYEVGEDVAGRLQERFGAGVVRGGHADLPAAAEVAVRGAGCSGVERIDLCTSCHAELFFSHRRDSGVTGRQGLIGRVG